MIEYFLNLFLYTNPFFFMYFYSYEDKYFEKFDLDLALILSGLFSVFVIWKFSLSYAFFTSSLLIQYVFFVVYAKANLEDRFGVVKSICLAFLIVYFNSFFWEFILHLTELQTFGFRLSYVQQFWRLTPLVFFHKRFKIFDKKYIDDVLKAFFVSTVLAIIVIEGLNNGRLQFIPIIYENGNKLRRIIWFINRLYCLTVLVDIFNRVEEK